MLLVLCLLIVLLFLFLYFISSFFRFPVCGNGQFLAPKHGGYLQKIDLSRCDLSDGLVQYVDPLAGNLIRLGHDLNHAIQVTALNLENSWSRSILLHRCFGEVDHEHDQYRTFCSVGVLSCVCLLASAMTCFVAACWLCVRVMWMEIRRKRQQSGHIGKIRKILEIYSPFYPASNHKKNLYCVCKLRVEPT